MMFSAFPRKIRAERSEPVVGGRYPCLLMGRADPDIDEGLHKHLHLHHAGLQECPPLFRPRLLFLEGEYFAVGTGTALVQLSRITILPLGKAYGILGHSGTRVGGSLYRPTLIRTDPPGATMAIW